MSSNLCQLPTNYSPGYLPPTAGIKVTDAADTRRTTIELPSQLASRLDTSLEWGMRKAIFTKLTELLLELIERRGKTAVYMMMAGRVEFRIKGDENEAQSKEAP